jgi:hypothetical protein
MLHRLACLLVSFLAVSCDPEGAPVVDEGKAGTRSDAPGRDKPAEREAAPEVSIGTAPAPVVAEVPAGRSGFVDCLLRCDGAKMSHAEKATCRYNCEGVAPGAPVVAGNPGASDTDPVGSVVRCLGGCSGAAAGTCVSACKDAVQASLMAPSRAVLDELGTCVVGCHNGKHTKETNVATCELNCAEAARVAGPAQP